MVFQHYLVQQTLRLALSNIAMLLRERRPVMPVLGTINPLNTYIQVHPRYNTEVRVITANATLVAF